MGKVIFIQSSSIPIGIATNYKASSACPEYWYSNIILLCILFYGFKNSTSTIRKSIFIDKTSGGASILKIFSIVIIFNLRLGGNDFAVFLDRKSTRLNSSHVAISYA